MASSTRPLIVDYDDMATMSEDPLDSSRGVEEGERD